MAEPTFEQLQARLVRLLPVLFEGVVYRSSTPKYATEADLLTGEGSKRVGGRWNPKGIPAVYASLSPETAMAETLAHHRYFHIPIEDAMPRTFVAIAVQVARVLDLRDAVVRRRLRVSGKAILTVDWRAEVKAGCEPLTQRLGRAAYSTGAEGLIVPSAADPTGSNLILFPDHLDHESDVRLLHPDQLRPT